MKFFQLIPSGTNFEFVAGRGRFILLSAFLITASIGMMLFNQMTRGSALNFGIDFEGGSQVRLALSKPVEVKEIRSELQARGYDGSSAVVVPDATNEVLIRVKEVVTTSPEQVSACQKSLENLAKGTLAKNGFDLPKGSSKIFLKFTAEPPSHSDIERVMKSAGCEGRSEAGVGKKEGEFPVEFALIGVGQKLVDQIEARFGNGTVDHIVSSETVGAKVGNELKVKGLESLLYSMGFIFLYVMIRFDLRFAPGGIVALLHDSTLVVGAFALTWREFNLQTVAAILTVIGYSINDTIVVFDRVRERIALFRDDPVDRTTNVALNETLSRTILTSGTTLLVLLSILVLGSGTIKDFAFALVIGIIVGTYSSLYIACPTFLWINNRFYHGKGHLIGLEAQEREGTGTLLGEGGKARDSGVSGHSSAGDDEALSIGEDQSSSSASGSADKGASGGERKASRRRRRRS